MYHKLVDERQYSKIFQIINLCLYDSYTDTLNLLRCKKTIFYRKRQNGRSWDHCARCMHLYIN